MILAFLGPNELSVIERCPQGEVRMYTHIPIMVKRGWDEGPQ